MLSCDVSAGYDPSYAEAFEKKNAAFLGRGVCFNKYTGSRGKSGSNDANAEFMGRLRAIMDGAGVAFQTAELAAAAPSPTSAPSTAWKSSTAESPCSPCTPPGRSSAKPTSTKPSRGTTPSC